MGIQVCLLVGGPNKVTHYLLCNKNSFTISFNFGNGYIIKVEVLNLARVNSNVYVGPKGSTSKVFKGFTLRFLGLFRHHHKFTSHNTVKLII